MNRVIESKQILKDLHAVLIENKQRFIDEYIEQEVTLSETFKVAFRNHLVSKECSVEYNEKTTLVTNSNGQHIYIANQWFVIASYFVDFCSEMISYRTIFEKICRRMGMNNKAMKEYATRLKSCPTDQDKTQYINVAFNILHENFPDVNDDYKRVAVYLWKFASDYSWWAGNKTIDRHDFYISSLLNQANVVNANAEFLAIIALAYSSVLKLRILIDDVDNIAVGLIKSQRTGRVNKVYSKDYEPEESCCNQDLEEPYKKGISISAASLERFQSKG